ncbi:ABC transporter permease [Clostridium luticellarii]|uniref:Bicarbonate transport system permease protein CmpB n=1 Tax=Clostridium luticellarii TaxID=1691940 RepID=A0A2T0BN11_9CLOT|nr:ABC transporter permease [Clostridium luticellarii]MCI1945137.1 ABC transporter permease [Clostridium luticellarii]MCI1968526.1 ABC transporter permease [Clostridium luticellarii]MCI1995979.1 ABC transporter permease [Clostridium luticellarii]MCI2040478.1 ABC transporter permease [Clostridium luticellarii]PRR85265.1 Bicarbonate transport system permease protein CmpB [Clostridium luticellarii]
MNALSESANSDTISKSEISPENINKIPIVKAPDTVNWKPKSKVWPILQIAAFAAALAESIALPTVQMVKDFPYKIMLILFIAYLIIGYAVSFFNEKLSLKVNHKSQFYFAIGIGFTIWDILSTKTNILPLPFFPGPAQIVQVLVEDSGTLLISTLYSMRLLALGFIAGTILGLVSGILMGWYKQWYYWFFPVLKIIGVVPAVAWIPVAMSLFPSTLISEVFLIVLCVWFPVAFMACGGIENIPRSYFEAAKTLGANEKFLIFKIAIPGAMPSIFTGIYTATGLSFTTLVVSEMLGAEAGLGWYINWAKGWSNYAKVYAAIVIMAIVFSIVLAIIFRIRDRVLIWQRGLLK